MGYLDAIARLEEEGRRTMSPRRPWLTAWRELANLTYGITPDDVRLGRVLETLNQCDQAFAQDDWAAFKRAAHILKSFVGDEAKA